MFGGITAVELGADTCALASTSVRRGAIRLLAAEMLDPRAFPGIDAFTLAVRQARLSLKLPRRCRAVVWGLPDGASRKDPSVAQLIEPLVKAGLRVERVVTPCNALGALARLRTSRTGGAMCWLGINRGGVAIVVVRPGKLLYSHSFAWDSSMGSTGSQARLLQRYSLVSFLAPEVRRALAVAREKGTTVDGIVTCGNLPDLRSMTMPLIEELDVEVETLDSLEGLVVAPTLADRIAEAAPALRLACAAALARGTRSVDEKKRRRVRTVNAATLVLRTAVAAALVLALGYVWRPRINVGTVVPPSTTVANAPVAKQPAPKQASTSATAPAVPSPPAAAKSTPSPTLPPPPVTVAKSNPPPSLPPPGPPRANTPSTAVPPTVSKAGSPSSAPPPVTSVPMRSPAEAAKPPGSAAARVTVPTMPLSPLLSLPVRRTPLPTVPVTASVAVRPPPSEPPTQPGRRSDGSREVGRTANDENVSPRTSLSERPAPLNKPVAAADKPDAPPAVSQASRATPALLKDPIPRVTAILVSSDRRFATVGDEGQIIGVGDVLGRRTVVGIDERAVVLREPSGMQIRVGLGGRIIGVERRER